LNLKTRYPFAAALALAVVIAAALAGCASSVKLDEIPVETRTPTPVVRPQGGPSATTPATAASAAQSPVAMVDLSKSAAGNANPASSGKLARVVYFDYDSNLLKDEYRPLIEAHARALLAASSQRLVIEGHTDERGGSEYNLALGQKRADAVLKSLTLLGVPERQLEAVSIGKERPATDGHDEAAWARNRRAELKDK
jgi:peptidoglycan-associated lipoprotein